MPSRFPAMPSLPVMRAPAVGVLLALNTSHPVGNTIANTVTETAFATSYTFPVAGLEAPGAYRLFLAGVYSTDVVAPTLIGRVKLGGTTIASTGTLSALVSATSNNGWRAVIDIAVHSVGTSGEIDVQGEMTFATSATAALVVLAANTANFTVNTTTTQALTVTIQWGTASASNTVSLRQFRLHRLAA